MDGRQAHRTDRRGFHRSPFLRPHRQAPAERQAATHRRGVRTAGRCFSAPGHRAVQPQPCEQAAGAAPHVGARFRGRLEASRPAASTRPRERTPEHADRIGHTSGAADHIAATSSPNGPGVRRHLPLRDLRRRVLRRPAPRRTRTRHRPRRSRLPGPAPARKNRGLRPRPRSGGAWPALCTALGPTPGQVAHRCLAGR